MIATCRNLQAPLREGFSDQSSGGGGGGGGGESERERERERERGEENAGRAERLSPSSVRRSHMGSIWLSECAAILHSRFS